MNDPYWLNYPKKQTQRGKKYLKKQGYGDHDIRELAQARPTKNPPGPNRNQLRDIVDSRPNAEIVAIARMVYLAEAVLEAHRQNDRDAVIELTGYLGYQEATTQLFVLDPGHPADMALKHNDYLAIALASEKFGKQHVQKAFQLMQSREKKAEKRSERNDWICYKGTEILEAGKHPRFISDKVAKAYCRSFPDKPPLSSRQVRRILREKNVLPPVTSRNEK